VTGDLDATSRRHHLRSTFDQVPELYERARPAYPEQLFDDLAALAKLRPGARLVEIGCGTGQATLPLAERGFEIVCVELGAGLAAVARGKLAAYPKVEIVNADFERWEPAARDFDGVVVFTAFHWLDPERRYERAARLLRRHGALAVVHTQHVLPAGGDPFWVEVQADYDAIVPSDENRPPPYPDQVGDLGGEMEASPHFSTVAVRRYLWEVSYSAADYLAVLNTYSGHRLLDEGSRQRLYDRIRSRIEDHHDRRVAKTYLAILNVAHRAGSSSGDTAVLL